MVRAWRKAWRNGSAACVLAAFFLPVADARSADLSYGARSEEVYDCTRPPRPPGPRYFPRAEGDSITDGPPALPIPFTRCTTNLTLVPTDSPEDPSYAGSPYGLGKPSYYGFRPPLGQDDPFGRPIRVRPYP